MRKKLQPMNYKIRYFLVTFLLAVTTMAYSQVPNDDCIFATHLGIVDDYCSGEAAFTNLGATADPTQVNTCFSVFDNGVWFSFTPQRTSAIIKTFGSGIESNTASFPAISIFSDCNTMIKCSPGNSRSTDELIIDNLILGKVYWIFITSEVGSEGTFELCIEGFNAPASPESDCDEAVVLCDKSPFIINALTGSGSNTSEVSSSDCIGGEFDSGWYKWTCDESGSLTFTITPNDFVSDTRITDDIDFIIYELPNGLNDCAAKQKLLCMGSGANTNGSGGVLPLSEWMLCNGPTGLRVSETDTNEDGGCLGNSNNFITPLIMETGKSYALIINNFSRSGLGFGIEFGGTGTFLGPEADFIIEATDEFDCDKTIVFSDNSESLTDPIVNYTWNFGVGSGPSSAIGPGPHATIYESFGDKLASITVETSRGCQVTYIEKFFIEPCCDDLPEPNLSGDVTDVSCFGDMDGTILAEGSNGQPQYQYSLDGTSFQPSPLFLDLEAGDYEIFLQDIKGCETSTIVTIDEPLEIVVDAGQDTIVDLGFSVILDANYNPMKANDSIAWSPLTGIVLPCDGCLDLEIFPPGTTTYTLTVIDQNGCIGSDDITLRVNIVRPVYPPNVFSPNGDGVNDLFNLFGGPAVSQILDLKIFDRWGNLVYNGSPQINDRNMGWDGRFSGKRVETGVYAWVANVLFIDNVSLPFSGDLTVLR